MKLWIRYMLGIGIGIVFGFLVTNDSSNTVELVSFISEISLNIGRYTIIPLLFFLIPVSIFSLLEEKKLFRVGTKTVFFTVVAGALGVAVGGLMVVVLDPQRIPIIMAEATAPEIPGFQEILLHIFPANAAHVFWMEGAYLLPVAVFASLLGFGFARSHSFSEPVLDFFDSAARLIYTLTSWIVSVTGILLIAITTMFVIQLRSIEELGLFAEVVFAVLFGAGLILFIGIPLAVFLLSKRHNPATFLMAALPPVAAAAASGSHVFSLTTLMRTGRNNQGVSRKAESVIFGITTLFCRAGTAMVAMITFIVVLRSYSSLEISLLQIMGVGVSTFGLSFVLGNIPNGNILVFLALLSGLHGRGIPDGYLILLPLIPILSRVGAALDIAIAAAIAQIVGVQERVCKTVPAREFV